MSTHEATSILAGAIVTILMQSTTYATYESRERSRTDDYLGQISATALLSAEEEQRVARAARAGDAEAREHLVRANLRLVVSIAKKYRHSGVDMDDLIQDGNTGLLTAIDTFDPDDGHCFSTYAPWWLRQAISRSVADKARLIRIPVHLVERIARVRRYLASQDGARAPNAAQIAAALGLTERQVEAALGNIDTPISLDYPLGPDWDDGEFGDHVADQAADVEGEAHAQLMTAELRQALTQLCERDRVVLTLRFGLDGNGPRTLEAVGATLGVTRERIRQIESKALQQLRHPSVGGKLRGWLK